MDTMSDIAFRRKGMRKIHSPNQAFLCQCLNEFIYGFIVCFRYRQSLLEGRRQIESLRFIANL